MNIHVVMALFFCGIVTNGLRQLLEWSVSFTHDTLVVLSGGLFAASFVLYVVKLLRGDRARAAGEGGE